MIKGFGGMIIRRFSVLAHSKMRVKRTLTGVFTGFWKDTWTLVFRLLSTLTSTWRGISLYALPLMTKRDGHFDSHLTVRDSVEAHVELGVDCVAEVHHDLQEEVCSR